ncbi:ribosome biogenesis protein BOP1 isoform X1 [Cinnamomum micranthum f. kanehirae]|uniref:Ribosome biogenesis protein BOP1 homolog n=1 Tax=Cinnamomum micranthum f. kanehirae TaxID=337451 RepID=A0A3S3NIS7_9MAGN|nr:ribosome biogenesis protein BOP1 isoform X1 [Cinnamomum micranthum f. kanehirae]
MKVLIQKKSVSIDPAKKKKGKSPSRAKTSVKGKSRRRVEPIASVNEGPNEHEKIEQESSEDEMNQEDLVEDNETHQSIEENESSEDDDFTRTEEIKDSNEGHLLGDDDEAGEAPPTVEESDSSEDEVPSRNTVGDVPLKWYEDEEHIGYDITGKKIKKQARKDKLESFLAGADDAKNWRKVYDEYNDEEVELTKQETKLIRRMLKGRTPHAEVDPYAPYVDWFVWDDKKHPLSNAPEPKRRFIPSKWESKKVVEYVRAIRKGLIKFDKPKEEPRFYLLWGDDSSSTDKSGHGLSYIPAPKPKVAGHEESYNPSIEYIPTQEEINSYQLMYEEDRPKFIPRRFESLRTVPAYDNALKESFDRCLDLYLCPRTRKKRINIDPESLKPKLPSRKDLRPYPMTCYLEYGGHSGAVMSISIDVSGQWIASGSMDATIRIWEVETGRCRKVWGVDEAVQHVAWNPLPELPILAACVGQDVLLLNTGLGNDEEQQKIKELLHVDTSAVPDESGSASIVSWLQYDKHEGIRLKHHKTVSSVEWHRKGDYFTTIVPGGDTRAILLHQLSKKLTHNPFKKLHGLPVSAVFHPSRSMFFVATKKTVRVYDLLKLSLIKKLETGLREVSSIAIHPAGDNLIVGSKEGKLCWFDMDLSSKPYRILKSHPKDITNVAFHRSYPLFASSSEDGTAYVFHGMVYSDLNQNPLIVPLEILRGHSSTNGRGVMDCKFHPRQPWLFTAGADSVIKLFCH